MVNIQAAKTHLSRLIDEAAAGADIVIARAGKPVAKLTSLTPAAAKPKRVLGALAGQLKIPEDFDAPLPEVILHTFEGRR